MHAVHILCQFISYICKARHQCSRKFIYQRAGSPFTQLFVMQYAMEMVRNISGKQIAIQKVDDDQLYHCLFLLL